MVQLNLNFTSQFEQIWAWWTNSSWVYVYLAGKHTKHATHQERTFYQLYVAPQKFMTCISSSRAQLPHNYYNKRESFVLLLVTIALHKLMHSFWMKAVTSEYTCPLHMCGYRNDRMQVMYIKIVLIKLILYGSTFLQPQLFI